jgi:D-glycero-alpha-D-manno-heptose 1-phosphate guanylyltransferase
MDAIILAGGLGTRLRSIVSDVPKCLANIAGKPCLEHILDHFSNFDQIQKVIISIGYLGEQIQKWIEESKDKYKFDLICIRENEPLGTGGAITKCLKVSQSDLVLISNGDTLFKIDIDRMASVNFDYMIVGLKEMCDFDRYGTVILDEHKIITSFSEKRFVSKGLINGGVYLIRRDNVDFSFFPEKFSFEKDFLEKIVGIKTINGFISEGYFVDIGIPEDYKKANEDLNF